MLPNNSVLHTNILKICSLLRALCKVSDILIKLAKESSYRHLKSKFNDIYLVSAIFLFKTD